MEVCSHNSSDPNTVLLKVNGTNCDLACKYCSEIRKEFKHSMTEHECAKTIEALPSSCEIILHGGEPLLDERLVKTAIKAFCKKSNGHKLAVQTHGRISSEMRKILLENSDILQIGISIDGAAAQNMMRTDAGGTPVFLDVDETISYFEENNTRIKCIATVNSASVQDPIGTLNYFLSHKNIKQVRFNPCFDVSNNLLAPYAVSPLQFYQFIRSIADYWITQGVYQTMRIDPLQAELETILEPVKTPYLNCCKFISVYADGNCTICDALGAEKFKVNNPSDVFNFADSQFLRDLVRPCSSCSEYSDCGGGCVAIFKRFNFSRELIQEYCSYRKGIKKYIKSLVSSVTTGV